MHLRSLKHLIVLTIPRFRGARPGRSFTTIHAGSFGPGFPPRFPPGFSTRTPVVKASATRPPRATILAAALCAAALSPLLSLPAARGGIFDDTFDPPPQRPESGRPKPATPATGPASPATPPAPAPAPTGSGAGTARPNPAGPAGTPAAKTTPPLFPSSRASAPEAEQVAVPGRADQAKARALLRDLYAEQMKDHSPAARRSSPRRCSTRPNPSATTPPTATSSSPAPTRRRKRGAGWR